MSDDFTFERLTTVELTIAGDFIAEFDAVALIRAYTEFGEWSWDVTDWRYECEDKSHKSLHSPNGTNPLKVCLYDACKVHEASESFRRYIGDELSDYVGPISSSDDEHRLSQSAFL